MASSSVDSQPDAAREPGTGGDKIDLQHLQPQRTVIKDLMNVVHLRRQGLDMALALGFSQPEATKIAVVISELGRNILLYTQGGTITLIPHVTGKKGVKIIAQDRGPGFENMDAVLAGGYSTSDGLGLGVSGSSKLMDEFDIRTIAGVGTTITAVKWLDREG